MNETTTTGWCAICQEPSIHKCGGCKSVSYCGVEHQKEHWKQHKLTCRPFEITSTPELNRVLIATRDIPAGSAIFTELPLIFGPKWSVDDHFGPIPMVPCVGCFNLTPITGHRCPVCFWPACRPDCSKLFDPNYHGIECSILALRREPPEATIDQLVDYFRCDALLTLKCVLLQKLFKKRWDQLITMECHDKERKGTALYEEADKRIVQYLQEKFLEPIRIAERRTGKSYLPRSDSEILHKICAIIEINFMLIGLPNGHEMSGVYPTACILEHSCVPNCYYTFDVNHGYKITVKAGVDIKKGEHLKIMYTHMLWGTQIRREHLRTTKYFECMCERCKDPTELNTYISALKCIGPDLAPCGGYQTAENPLNPTTDWVCEKCPSRISAEHESFLMSKMQDEVDTATTNKMGNIKELESLIDKFSQFLHPNHYHIFALKHALIQQYGHQPGYLPEQMSDEMFNKKIQMCKDLLSVVKKLDPASMRLSIYTSIILYELTDAIMEKNKKKLDPETHTEAKNYISEAKKIIEIELDSPTGRQLFEKINNLEILIN